MKAVEFETTMNSNGQILLPADLAGHIPFARDSALRTLRAFCRHRRFAGVDRMRSALQSGSIMDGGFSMASLDWSQCTAVESVPGKVSGAWVLKGTRMPVSAIFENLEAGASLDDIMEWFDGLNREQVKAVIEFAARSLDRPPALTLR